MGFLAIALGAIGSHRLEGLDPEFIRSFETAIRYQMYHALLFLFLSGYDALPLKVRRNAYIIALAGVVLFSGSIYLKTLARIYGFETGRVLLTPLGGGLLIIAWLYLAFYAFAAKKR